MQGYDGPVMVNQCVIADSIQLWVPFLKHTFITFLLCVCVRVCACVRVCVPRVWERELESRTEKGRVTYNQTTNVGELSLQTTDDLRKVAYCLCLRLSVSEKGMHSVAWNS